jgi:hypothetical protein
MYIDPTGHAAVQLRDLAAATGSSVAWNAKSGVATVTLSPGVSVQFNTKNKKDQQAKGYSIQNGRIVLDNERFDSLMSQSYTKSKSSLTGGRVDVKSVVDTAVGDNKLVGYVSVTKTYNVAESQHKPNFAANLNIPQLPLVVKEKERIAVVDLTTHKSDSIDLVSGKGLTKKRETLIKNIAAGSEGTVSRPQAALITLLLGQDNSTFSKHLEEKYSGSFSGDLINKESSNEYFIVNLTSSEIMDVGKTHNEKGLKRCYKQIYPEATEQDFQNYVKTLSQAQSGDMVDVLVAFFSKEVLLYGRYNRDGDLANIALAMTRLPLGFGISKGVAKFAPKPEVPSSLKPQGAGEYASSAAQYQRLKDSLAKEEIQSVIKTTDHGAERLMSRGFTPSEISDLKLSPSKVMTQSDGAGVYIKDVGAGNFNVIVESENGVVTALKNISEGSLNRLSKNYGWK